MICVGYTCTKCKHLFNEKIDGWIPACKAFPEGIPKKVFFEPAYDPVKIPECNNGIGYELDPKKESFW